MKYTKTIEMEKASFELYNKQLKVEELSELSAAEKEKLEIKEDGTVFGIIHVQFENKAILNMDMCYTSTNAYEDTVISTSDEKEYFFDPMFEIGEVNEFTVGDDTYIVNIKLV